MTSWFFATVPASRYAIENQVRWGYWKAGYGQVFLTCTKDQAPFELEGRLGSKHFSIEWEPKNFLMLKLQSADEYLLLATQRALGHKALAAYKTDAGIVVEWRGKDYDARYKELQASGVQELQRLDK